MTRWLAIAALALLAGCTEMMEVPTADKLDWNPDRLSASGCPDLSGKYLAPKPAATSYRWAFPSGSERELHPSREIYLRDKDLNVYISIESRQNGIRTEASDGRNHVESFSLYDGKMIGCQSGTLVSRFVYPLRRPGESGGGTCLSYGENRASLNSHGNLVIVFARRQRCSTWGALANRSPISETVAAPSIFQRIK
jgi:hypothetical protein